MRSILFILFFSCSNQPNKDVKNKLTHDLEKQECKKFVFPIDVKRLTKVIVLERESVLKEIKNKNEMDSIIKKLENSCSVFIKTSSHKSLDFYENDSLRFSMITGDKYFKYAGVVYEFKNK